MKNIELCYIWNDSLRVDILISTLFSDFSRAYIAKCIKRWEIQVNWLIPKKNTHLKYWDILVFSRQSYGTDILPEFISLDIIYEDDNLIILNKDAGINVHPVPWVDWKTGTLVNALMYHTKSNLPLIWWEERPGIVHRLDKDTSWALLVAKNDQMMQHLSSIIKDRKIKKYYLVVTVWTPSEKKFTITSHIWRDRYERTKMTIRNPLNPKEAVTHVEVIWNYNEKYWLLKVDLQTGRTHQIRVHLASLWYPILWDCVYGNFHENKTAYNIMWIQRQMLHAYMLEFELYERKSIFEAKLKNDMKVFFTKNLQ